MTVTRDLTEIGAIVFLLTSLFLLRSGKDRWATLLLTLALLTRESTVLFALACAVLYLIQSIRRKSIGLSFKWYYFVVPLIIFAIWQFWLFSQWGEFSFSESRRINVGSPIVDFVQFASGQINQIGHTSLIAMIQHGGLRDLVLILLLLILPMLSLRSSRAGWHEKIAWLFYALATLVLSPAIWRDSYLRVSADLSTLAGVVLLGSPQRSKKLLFIYVLAVWLLASHYNY